MSQLCVDAVLQGTQSRVFPADTKWEKKHSRAEQIDLVLQQWQTQHLMFSPKSGRSQGKGPVFPCGGTLTSRTAASLLPGLCDQKVICYEPQRKVGVGIDGSPGLWWGVNLMGLPVPGDVEDVEEQRRSHNVLSSL